MKTQLILSAGDDTDALADYLLNELDDATLDQIEVEREQAPAHGLANEPVTIALALTLGPPLIGAITTLVGKWMDSRAKEREVKLEMAMKAVPDRPAQPDEAEGDS